ncbi:MAG TPA: hypothetical protein VKW08_27200 [Xanthobacteraceae bacterium]|nr:hypothetical protein [Xanthobacteraceae bacterium]
MTSETDAVRKVSFRLLRDMWLALADVGATLSAEELEREIAAIDQIHTNYLRATRTNKM